jgi:glutamyl-tRNA(Gln) amidotransferase subunit E
MILAKDGLLELENGKKIGIDILCLEEDAARKIETKGKTNIFRLDRLGIPLVEVTTDPDINDPHECRETAERLGLLLWSTNVKKVLGSIRQDVNVSIAAGTRIEIKGVQKLDWIPILINHEVSRQLKLVEIKEELEKRGLVAKGLRLGKKLFGMNFKGFKGIFGKELMEDYRFGTEVASKVKSISGLQGIIHSDEDLKKYKFSDADIKTLKDSLKTADDDCFILVLGTQKEVDKAIKVIINRVKYAFNGVPPETRRALENCNTEFLRELHGGARLYPDTDSQAIITTEDEIKEIKDRLPELPWKIIKDYSNKYNLDERFIKDLIFEGKLDVFDALLEIYPDNPMRIVTTLLETTTALRRDGKNIDNIKKKDYLDIFTLLSNGEISKEAFEDFMIAKADNPNLSIDEIKQNLNIEKISEEDLIKIINDIVENNITLLKERRMGAMGALMGDVMDEVHGKIDGKIVSQRVKEAITNKLRELE